MKLLFRFAIALLTFSSQAQTTFQISNWRLQIPTDFVLTSDHGYLIGGNMLDSSTGNIDEYALVKFDSSGNEQWAKMYFDFGHDSYV